MFYAGHNMTAAIALWQTAQATKDTAPSTAKKDDLHRLARPRWNCGWECSKEGDPQALGRARVVVVIGAGLLSSGSDVVAWMNLVTSLLGIGREWTKP